MKLWRLGVVALSLMAVVACAPVRVAVQADESVALASARSYRWETPPMTDSQCSRVAAAVDQAVRAEVDDRMKRLGFQKVVKGADLVVDYHVAVHEGVNLNGPWTSNDCFREWRSMKGRQVGPSVAEEIPAYHRDYELSIEMTSEKQELRWRGSALQLHSDELDEAGRAEFAGKAAEKLMKAFRDAQK